MDSDLKQRIMAEIAELVMPPKAREGDFSAIDFAEDQGIARSTAVRYLRRLEEAGVLESERALYNGKLTKVYRKARENGTKASLSGEQNSQP